MAKAKPLPPVEVLREHFSYDPETGIVTRIKANKLRPDTLGPVGSPEKHGHLVVGIGHSYFKVHRLAWKIYTGEEPPAFIDHANRNPSDNSWNNLRKCSYGQNRANSTRKEGKLAGA